MKVRKVEFVNSSIGNVRVGDLSVPSSIETVTVGLSINDTGIMLGTFLREERKKSPVYSLISDFARECEEKFFDEAEGILDSDTVPKDVPLRIMTVDDGFIYTNEKLMENKIIGFFVTTDGTSIQPIDQGSLFAEDIKNFLQK